MNKREMAKRLREWAKPATHYDDAATCEAAAEALEREAEREEKPSGGCSVSIAGGLVHGEFEQVKAVQALILENEKLRREAREREEQERPKVTLYEMRRACESCGSHEAHRVGALAPTLLAAADTLRRLREDGRKLLNEYGYTDHRAGPGLFNPDQFGFACAALLRSLGVEPAPLPEAGARSN